MDLSIIIPVYNTELSKLKKCIDSIIESINLKYEVIIVDDGSNSILSKNYRILCLKYKEVKYYKKDNGGVSSARNYGIELAIGTYLTFIDSDDTIEGRNIKKNDLNDDIIFYGYKQIFNDKKNILINHNFSADEIKYKALFSDEINQCWSKIYNRHFIVKNKIRFNEKMIQGEDALFLLNLIEFNPSISCVDSILYNYNYEKNNIKKRIEKNVQAVFKSYTILFHKRKNIALNLKYDEKKIYADLIDKIFRIVLQNKSFTLDNVYIQELENIFLNKKSLLKGFSKVKYKIIILNNKFINRILYLLKSIMG